MKIFSVKKTYRNLIRIKQVLQVFTRHGFGHIISQMNLPTYIPSLRNFFRQGEPLFLPEGSVATRLRLVLQDLGPTFVKLGQILAGRPDILPEEFTQEFKKLQDNVQPFPQEQVYKIIEKELGAPAQEIFASFDDKVLASGSIGQAHEARLIDGSEVIVKVKRPGIDKVIAVDVAILMFLADLAERYIEELQVIQPKLIVEEFSRTIRKELDFTLEASYCEKFYDLLLDDPYVYSPKVYWQYTTAHVITLEKLKGTNIGDLNKLREKGIDLPLLAKNLTSSFMQQYFIWGMFHADPHPGNILISDDGKINLLDFGSVGHLSNEMKNQLATIVLAIVHQEIDIIIEVYSDLGVFKEPVNTRELKADIVEILDKYFNTPFEHLDMAKAFQDLIELARSHKTRVPRDFILLIKSLVTVTTIAKDLDPNFNISHAASPHVMSILKEKFSFKRIASQSIFNIWSIFTVLQKLPSDIKQILRSFRAGEIRFVIHHEFDNRFIRELHRISNRIAASIVIGSTVIGAAVLLASDVGPKFHSLSFLGVIGVIVAVFLGLLLAGAMLRSRRM